MPTTARSVSSRIRSESLPTSSSESGAALTRSALPARRRRARSSPAASRRRGGRRAARNRAARSTRRRARAAPRRARPARRGDGTAGEPAGRDLAQGRTQPVVGVVRALHRHLDLPLEALQLRHTRLLPRWAGENLGELGRRRRGKRAGGCLRECRPPRTPRKRRYASTARPLSPGRMTSAAARAVVATTAIVATAVVRLLTLTTRPPAARPGRPRARRSPRPSCRRRSRGG